MPWYTEDQLQLAIKAVENGMPKAKAAREFGIPKSTLHDRIAGSTTRKRRDIDQQILSDNQENMLAQ